MALAGAWDGSNVHEDHITFLLQTQRLPGEGFMEARPPPETEISPEPREYLICTLFSAAFCIIGVAVFKKSQDRFIFYI